MTDQPEVTPLSAEEIAIAKRHRRCDRFGLRCEIDCGEECDDADSIRRDDRYLVTIDQLRAKVAELEASALDDGILAAIWRVTLDDPAHEGCESDVPADCSRFEDMRIAADEEIARRKGAK